MKAYEGKENFIFVSYAHKDSDRVIPIIEKLSERGFRVWYDSGIEVGSEWPEYIQDRINNCSRMLVFMSPLSIESKNCRNEINLALKKNKEMLIVYLEPTELIKGMDLQLNSVQAVNAEQYPLQSSLVDALCKSRILECCKADYTNDDIEENFKQINQPTVKTQIYKQNLKELETIISIQDELWQKIMKETDWLNDNNLYNETEKAKIKDYFNQWINNIDKYERILSLTKIASDSQFIQIKDEYNTRSEQLNEYIILFDSPKNEKNYNLKWNPTVTDNVNKENKKKTTKNKFSYVLFTIILEMISIMLCVLFSKYFFDKWDSGGLLRKDFYIGAGIVLLSTLCTFLTFFNISKKGFRWIVWLPNIIFLFILWSINGYKNDATLWYLPVTYIGVSIIQVILFNSNAFKMNSDSICGIAFAIASIFVLIVLVTKIVYCFQTANFLEPGFFRGIANFFIGIWVIIKGIILGLIQILALFIGGGYWMPNFYKGTLISSDVLNTIFFILADILFYSDYKNG